MALVKSVVEIQNMRRAGAMLARALAEVSAQVKEGMQLVELDRIAHDAIKQQGGEPAFLNYQPAGATRGFPATICASLNDVVVHGVPTRRELKYGDVLKIDLGTKYQGYYADAAITISIGKPTPEVQNLIHVTREALQMGIRAAIPGGTLGDIGYAIESCVRAGKLNVVKGLTGHFIGTELHEDPSVPNEGRPGKGMKLVPGMVCAIEPMVSMGSPKVIQQNDEGYRTSDGSISAHFEHTVLVTENGPEILTA
ncbi:MAG: type I methionyl aminopeptidase [Patescibacteria group bacterium]